MQISLEGSDIQSADAAQWVPWGTKGDAKERILGAAGGYVAAYVQADPGYSGDPHEPVSPRWGIDSGQPDAASLGARADDEAAGRRAYWLGINLSR